MYDWKIISNRIWSVGNEHKGKTMKKLLGRSIGQMRLEIIFQSYIDFSVYFCLLISNRTFIFYEKQVRMIKISK